MIPGKTKDKLSELLSTSFRRQETYKLGKQEQSSRNHLYKTRRRIEEGRAGWMNRPKNKIETISTNDKIIGIYDSW